MIGWSDKGIHTLTEIQEQIEEAKSRGKKQSREAEFELMRLEAEARAVAHQDYFAEHGEWDWIVRAEYMKLVKSMAHTFPWPDDTRGYAFELHNYTPRLPLTLMFEDYRPRAPFCVIPYRQEVLLFEYLTEFVKPENMEKCKLTPKIVDAFLLLPVLAFEEKLKGRGFGISCKEESWKDETGQVGPDFDYEGYKFHLVPGVEQPAVKSE